jgi:hypothetical protein
MELDYISKMIRSCSNKNTTNQLDNENIKFTSTEKKLFTQQYQADNVNSTNEFKSRDNSDINLNVNLRRSIDEQINSNEPNFLIHDDDNLLKPVQKVSSKFKKSGSFPINHIFSVFNFVKVVPDNEASTKLEYCIDENSDIEHGGMYGQDNSQLISKKNHSDKLIYSPFHESSEEKMNSFQMEQLKNGTLVVQEDHSFTGAIKVMNRFL